ncbi:hypothetical protein H2200_009745 [Cladophialophora chaetospira]|uniref:Uncharacterized protein n=1 Tax=Cladophialophora chaetospira TaxID=386627 RepID=A0AA38X305_9EURO|nr:hypothetical protein H2200_009745 [Cladophialophora chaetospira]
MEVYDTTISSSRLNHHQEKLTTAQHQLELLTLTPGESEADRRTRLRDCLSPLFTALTLSNVKMDQVDFEDLFSKLSRLTILTLHRGRSLGGQHTSSMGNLRLSDLYAAILKTKQTLKRLSIVYDIKTDGFQRDTSLLGSLTSFRALKHLTIKPCLLVGRCVCRYVSVVTPVFPQDEFAAMLPASIESLTLVIDTLQPRRIGNYRPDLLRGILQDRTRLRELGKVLFLEIYEYQSNSFEARCACPHSLPTRCFERKPDGTAKSPAMTGNEAKVFWEKARKCEEAGISVTLIQDEDVKDWSPQARYELVKF